MKFGSQSNLGAMSFLERGVLLGLDWGLEQVLEWASRSCILGPCVHVRVWVCVGKDKAKSLFTNHTSETKKYNAHCKVFGMAGGNLLFAVGNFPTCQVV